MTNYNVTREEALNTIDNEFADVITSLVDLGHMIKPLQGSTTEYSVHTKSGVLVTIVKKMELDPCDTFAEL